VPTSRVQFLDVEDLRQQVGKAELLRTLLAVRFLPGSVCRQVPPVPIDTPAVILFTSGSEKTPKAVPLTHRNIIANQRSALPCSGRRVMMGGRHEQE